MKKEKSVEKEKKSKKCSAKKVNIKEEIEVIDNLPEEINDEEDIENDTASIIKKEDLDNIIGRLESINYTILNDGAYIGTMNRGESVVTIIEGKKDPYIFDFGWKEGYRATRKFIMKVLVKNGKGYIHSTHLANIHDYLSASVEYDEKEINRSKGDISRLPSIVVKDREELIKKISSRLEYKKKILDYLTEKRKDLIEEVSRYSFECRKSWEKTQKQINTKKETLEKEIFSYYGILYPTKELRKKKKETENIRRLRKSLIKSRKLEILLNYRLSKYRDISFILNGVDKKIKEGENGDD